MKKLIGLNPFASQALSFYSVKPLSIKTNVMKVMIAFFAISLFSFQQANAQKLVTVKSAKSYDETVGGIKKGVADAGMMVVGRN